MPRHHQHQVRASLVGPAGSRHIHPGEALRTRLHIPAAGSHRTGGPRSLAVGHRVVDRIPVAARRVADRSRLAARSPIAEAADCFFRLASRRIPQCHLSFGRRGVAVAADRSFATTALVRMRHSAATSHLGSSCRPRHVPHSLDVRRRAHGHLLRLVASWRSGRLRRDFDEIQRLECHCRDYSSPVPFRVGKWSCRPRWCCLRLGRRVADPVAHQERRGIQEM